jgi:hypothetical protein
MSAHTHSLSGGVSIEGEASERPSARWVATNTIQQRLKGRVVNTPVYKAHRTEVCEKKMPNVRRSLTIIEENDERVQQRRAMFLSIKKTPIDMDYTTMVNMFIELGDFLFKQDWTKPNITMEAKEVGNIVSRYISSPTIKEEGLIDQYRDALLRDLPRFVELYQQATAMQKQNPPEAKQTEQETPRRDKQYIS